MPALLGVKAIGDVVRLGLTYNQARVLDGLDASVYGNPGFLTALDMDPLLAGEVATADIDPMPHFVLKLKPPPSGSEQKSLNDTSSRKIPLAGKKGQPDGFAVTSIT
jgi:hypothetical protein